MKGGSRTRTLCLLALVAGLLAAPSAAAAPKPIFGFNDTAETFAARADAVKGAGAKMARIPVSWERTERWRGSYDFGWLDDAVTELGSRGVRPLFVLHAAPGWAAPDCNRFITQTCAPGEGFEGAYAELALRLLQRYRGSQIQAWNEPNLREFGDISPERAAELTNVLYGIAPRKVIGPAASPGGIDYMRYTAAAYRQIRPEVPLALNIYPRSVISAGQIGEDWRRAERIAGRRPIWVTEIGFSTSEFGPRGQAWHTAAAYRYLARHGARAIIFHCLQDSPTAPSPWLGTLGVLRSDGARKPAYRALRKAVASFR
jgi:hypothetical protein